MKRSSLGLMVALTSVALLASCSTEKITGFSSADKEFFNEGAPFQRGTLAIGESCEARRDCDSLNCEYGICTQPCTAVACPRGSICTGAIEIPDFQCNSDDDCWANQEACPDQGCLCGLNGNCYFEVQPICLQLCIATGCLSDRVTCSDHITGADICMPGADSNPQPPVGAPVGEPCPNGDECSQDLICEVGIFTVGFCTRNCTADGVCPDGSHCIEYDQDYRLCLDDCSADGVCGVPEATCADFNGLLICY